MTTKRQLFLDLSQMLDKGISLEAYRQPNPSVQQMTDGGKLMREYQAENKLLENQALELKDPNLLTACQSIHFVCSLHKEMAAQNLFGALLYLHKAAVDMLATPDYSVAVDPAPSPDVALPKNPHMSTMSGLDPLTSEEINPVGRNLTRPEAIPVPGDVTPDQSGADFPYTLLTPDQSRQVLDSAMLAKTELGKQKAQVPNHLDANPSCQVIYDSSQPMAPETLAILKALGISHEPQVTTGPGLLQVAKVEKVIAHAENRTDHVATVGSPEPGLTDTPSAFPPHGYYTDEEGNRSDGEWPGTHYDPETDSMVPDEDETVTPRIEGDALVSANWPANAEQALLSYAKTSDGTMQNIEPEKAPSFTEEYGGIIE